MKKLLIIVSFISGYLSGMNSEIVAQAVAAAQLVLIQKEQAKEKKRKADLHIEDSSSKKLKTVPSAVDVVSKDSANKKKKKCEVCGKFYANAQVLKIHMRTHTDERPFKCDSCDYEARQSHTLIEHKRIHTGEKPHKCDLCGRVFAQRSNMRQHKKKCAGSGEKPSEEAIVSADGKYAVESGDSNSVKKKFICEECGTCFATDTFLKLHKTVHAKNTNQEAVLEPIYNNGLFTVSDDETEQPKMAPEHKAPLKNKFVVGPEITVTQYPLLSKMFEGKNIVDMYNGLEILQKIDFQTKIVNALEKELGTNSRDSNIALSQEIDSFMRAHSNDLIPLIRIQIQEKLNKIKLQLGAIE